MGTGRLSKNSKCVFYVFMYLHIFIKVEANANIGSYLSSVREACDAVALDILPIVIGRI